MENRNTTLLDFQSRGRRRHAEVRPSPLSMRTCPAAVGSLWPGDRDYDTREFAATCCALKVTPHMAQNQARTGGSALDARTIRHRSDAVSQWVRKRIEETFAWMKAVGSLRRTCYRGRARVQMHAYLVAATHNPRRIAKLSPAPSMNHQSTSLVHAARG